MGNRGIRGSKGVREIEGVMGNKGVRESEGLMGSRGVAVPSVRGQGVSAISFLKKPSESAKELPLSTPIKSVNNNHTNYAHSREQQITKPR